MILPQNSTYVVNTLRNTRDGLDKCFENRDRFMGVGLSADMSPFADEGVKPGQTIEFWWLLQDTRKLELILDYGLVNDPDAEVQEEELEPMIRRAFEISEDFISTVTEDEWVNLFDILDHEDLNRIPHQHCNEEEIEDWLQGRFYYGCTYDMFVKHFPKDSVAREPLLERFKANIDKLDKALWDGSATMILTLSEWESWRVHWYVNFGTKGGCAFLEQESGRDRYTQWDIVTQYLFMGQVFDQPIPMAVKLAQEVFGERIVATRSQLFNFVLDVEEAIGILDRGVWVNSRLPADVSYKLMQLYAESELKRFDRQSEEKKKELRELAVAQYKS